MATNVDFSQLNGNFKQVYASKEAKLIPDVAVLTRMVPFSSRNKLGDYYNQMVQLTSSQGVTYNSDGSAFAINTPIAMTTKNAQLRGSEILVADRISYKAAVAASHGSTKSFVDATRFTVDTMLQTMTKRLEIAMLYGGSGIAQTASSSNVDSTHTTVTISDASWAVGIWSGLENAQIQFYTSVPALVSSGADSIFTIDSMDVDAKTVTLSGTSTGITALDSAIGSGTCDAYFYGAYGVEMAGINKIITNTGSLFGIDASTYNLWKGNVHTVTGTLSLSKIYGGISKAVGRGLNENVTCFVNPDTWKDLASDLAAARVLDSSYKTGKLANGMQAIEYYAQNGKVDIVNHSCVKAGDAFVLPMDRLTRLGATDVQFQSSDNRYFTPLQSNAGFELRAYTDQALYVDSPARCVKITGFTNS